MSYHKSTLDYLHHLKKANTEEAKKQLFYNLLNDWFKKDEDAKAIISQMALGAEKAVFNIPKGGRNKTGRADTQYRQVIIEFENDIQAKTKREHAEYQLKEYFAGNYNSGDAYDFYLIATDCIRWAIYGVMPESYLGKKHIKPDEIQLKVVESFVLSDDTAQNFFQFIDRYLFRFEKQQATLDHILIDFGDSSALFINVFGEMLSFYHEHQNEAELQTAYDEWKRFMSVAYGSFEDSREVFVVHSYLSVFAKLIAYEVITKDNYIDYEEMRRVLNGTMFDKYNVSNFVENDFYQWVVVDKFFNKLHRHFTKIAEKISDYDFTNVKSDILKGVYQKLIDLETRHALGEYYTPDWLCETVVRHFDFEPKAKILDPSCGSGSFLLAVANRLKNLHPSITAEDLSAQVVGIDIHPLSVQIAKTTLLLAIGNERILEARKPISLRVYLSNSLITPQLTAVNLFGEEFGITLNQKKYYLPTGTFDDPDFFDQAVDIADHFAESTKGEQAKSKEIIQKTIENRLPNANKALSSKFYEIYLGMKEAKETGKDSIWKFILQNTYKPFFLKNKFDYIIGNPPWFTYNSIKNAEYQALLRSLADKYDVTPEKKANMPNLEIAAIFMSHCSKYLLKQQGKLAFVLPRSFLSAEHHDNTRSGKSAGFTLTEIWDLDDVQPLFNVPSCVLFAETALKKTEPKQAGIVGRSYKGRPRQHNATYEAVQDRVSFVENRWYYVKLSKSSAYSTSQIDETGKTNFYKEFFRKGAELTPRNFYFIELLNKKPNDWDDRVLTAKSNSDFVKDSKMPWKEIILEGNLNSRYFFRTIVARNIIPFGLISPPLISLPLNVITRPHPKGGGFYERKFELFELDDIYTNGNLETYDWYKKVEFNWNKHKTENNAKLTSIDYINWQKKLTEQNLDKSHIVIYSGSAQDTNALVFKRGSLDLELIVDTSTYYFSTDLENEAFYLSAFLNSETPNLLMKPFQSSGLFGPRNIHKKILDVPLPKYDEKNETHLKIAEMGKKCSEIVGSYIKTQGLEQKEYNVGKERSIIRKMLINELKEIDELLLQLIA